MAELIEIPRTDGTTEAYLAGGGDTSRPGVLFFMDAIGLRPRIEQMADRIASWGYVVLAPNVFYRSGSIDALAPQTDLTTPEGRDAFFATGVMDRIAGLTPNLSTPDTHAWISTLLDHSKGVLGATGYCMGARLAARAAALRPDLVKAVGGFHGGNLVTDAPDSPHLALSHARAEFVFGHADNDPSMSPNAVAVLGTALEDAGLVHRNEVYVGAAHGFTMADTATYNQGAAERHFAVLRDVFDRQLRPVSDSDR